MVRDDYELNINEWLWMIMKSMNRYMVRDKDG